MTMQCGGAGHELITEFEFIRAFTCTYADVVGLLVLGMIVYGAVSLSIYIRTGSVIIPLVLLMTTGGATVAAMSPPAVTAATLLVLFGGGGAIAYLYYRYG